MKVEIHNDIIQIIDPSKEIIEVLSKHLYYEDKSKKYQLKKMSKNPFMRKSKQYLQLQQEVSGTLLIQKDSELILPSGFADLVISLVDKVDDHRKDTGISLSLPWKGDVYLKRPLRGYQQEAVDILSESYRGIMNCATGLGKSLTAIHLIRKLKKKSLIVCPSKAIAKQFYDELVVMFGENRIGFVGDGKFKLNDITVGIAMSVLNKVDLIKKHDLGVVIFDEAHHTPANTFYKIIAELGNIGRVYGLSATAFRSDGKDVFIQAGCGSILIERDVVWGVKNEWLAKPYFLVRKIPTCGTDLSDKLKAYQTHVLKCKETLSRIEEDSRKMMAAGKSTLILVDQIEHGEMLAKALGIPFAQGSDDQSEDYIKLLNLGKIPGLIGSEGKISEGCDTKNVDCIILATFPGSKGLVLQSIGRGLRKTDTKTHCIILDYILEGSSILSRHAMNRIEWYKEITSDVKIL